MPDSPPEGQDVLDVIYRTVHGYPDGTAALALRMGIPLETLRQKANRNNPQHVFHPKQLLDLMYFTDNVALLHAMADAVGYVCTPAVPDQSDGDPVEAFMLQQRAQGEYSAAVADAFLLHQPTPNAVRRVSDMAQDLIAKTGHQVAVLRGRMRKAPGGVL